LDGGAAAKVRSWHHLSLILFLGTNGMQGAHVKTFLLRIFVIIASFGATGTQSVTLYPPVNPENDEGKSLFSFKRGALKEVTKSTKDWNLAYGSMSIGNEDWFSLHLGPSRCLTEPIKTFKKFMSGMETSF
jgi:hypothetical protein